MLRGDYMDQNAKFIMTDDNQLAEQLLQCGYESIGKSGGLFIFENNPKNMKFDFAETEPWKFVFTNKLFL